MTIEDKSFEESTFRSPRHHVRRHPDHNAAPKNHPDDENRFFHDIARALDTVDEILIVGPSSAKTQLMSYLHTHDPKIEQRVVGTETVDHPTDAQLAAFARKYFHGADRLKGLQP
ncbi:MAG: translational machinery protein [Polyangiaceae bacterium]